MVEASCHCGNVTLRMDTAPVQVTDCNCSVCRRYGVLWAYYSPGQVNVAVVNGHTDTYRWGDRTLDFHRCGHCGCVTHWAGLDPERDRMGINARLLAPEVLSLARVRHLDGAGTEEYTD